MLYSLKDLENYTIGATDGDVGKVKDFYFDDHTWIIRYLIVETGDWLASRKVLISPQSIQYLDSPDKIMTATISQEQVRNSPDIDTDKPISRQHEMQYLGYYGYPYYWDGAGTWSGIMTPDMFPISDPTNAVQRAESEKANLAAVEAEHDQKHREDPHLRSCAVVTGYHIHATDGEIGHIAGFLIDEVNWAIRYLIVNTSNWWVGHQVLIAPQWFKDVDWTDAKISLALNRQSVMDAPPYESAKALNRKLESDLYAHYQRVGYWPTDTANVSVEAHEVF